MKQIKFRLDTTAEIFGAWLAEHRLLCGLNELAPEVAQGLALRLIPGYRRLTQDKSVVDGWVLHVTDIAEGGRRRTSGPAWRFSVRTLSLSPERIEVTARRGWEWPVLDHWFVTLVRDIGEMWPEAAPEVAKWLEGEGIALTGEAGEDVGKKRRPPFLQEREDWPGKIRKVEKYEKALARGVPAEVAADGEDPRTIRRWRQRMRHLLTADNSNN